MKIQFLFIAAAIILIGCKQNVNKEDKSKTQTESHYYQRYDHLDSELMRVPIPFAGKYPPTIDSLGIQKLYDDAKWNIFCINCLKTCEVSKQFKLRDTLIPLINLDVKYEGVKRKGDTLDMFFGFYFQDTFRCDELRCAKGYPIHGVRYELKSAHVLTYLSPNFEWDVNYLNQEKVKGETFIRSQRPQLNAWHREEAKIRGFIK